MKKYRIGIVGAGFGVLAHLPALANHSRFDVVALASPTTAARAARELKIPRAFHSCAAMVAQCDLDAVVVASPPFAHHEDVSAALSARKHVLCEKPFAISLQAAREMLDASRAAGCASGVAHEFRFVPQAAAIKELAVNGHLGSLRDVEITLLRPNLRREVRRPRSWWFDRERGGGMAGAVLSHVIDQANWLAGRIPVRTLGLRRTANPERSDDDGSFRSTADDGAFALLDYGDGLIARLCTDGTAAVEGYTCAVHGERRTAVASGSDIVETTLYCADGDEISELTCKPSPHHAMAKINANVPLLMELYDEFVKKIEGRDNALPSFEQAVVTQESLAAIGYEAS